MANTTLELPSDIWEIIVKQSKQSITDLLKDLSITELTEVIDKASKEKERKLVSMKNQYPLNSIINDAYNQKWIIVSSRSSQMYRWSNGVRSERFLMVERVYYTTETTTIGNYHKSTVTENTGNGKIDLSTGKLIICDCEETPIDFEIIQYQAELDGRRKARADELTIGDTFYCFRFNPTAFTALTWDYDSKYLTEATVKRVTPKYIFYDEYDVGGNFHHRRAEKTRVVW